MHLRILIFLLACCFIGNTTASDTDNSYTLYLVRHAEKQADGSRDPALTENGKNRSEQLAVWFQDKNIAEIWSSDYKRTRDTAKLLATGLDLEMRIYDPRNLPDLVEKLAHKQSTALIVGHSNTTPELARLLCDCSVADMDESEYDRLIVISVVGSSPQVRTLQQNHLLQ
ncbi:MAG: histidine phosphatase family protein [Gammaproteobacteria bacterium]|nr:MAG: histidine phosphatase family protein [Gammaproteobacteria bacterium]